MDMQKLVEKGDLMELKVTKEAILAGAKKCPQAKEVLKEMFPDVFKEEIDLTTLKLNSEFGEKSTELFSYDSFDKLRLTRKVDAFISVRTSGEYKHKAFYLGSKFDWSIGIDSLGQKVLVFTRKG